MLPLRYAPITLGPDVHPFTMAYTRIATAGRPAPARHRGCIWDAGTPNSQRLRASEVIAPI